MPIDFDKYLQGAIQSTLGEPIFYDIDGEVEELTAVYSQENRENQSDGAVYQATYYQIAIRLSDLSITPKKGHRLEMRDQKWIVESVVFDGLGGAALEIKKDNFLS